VAYIWFNRFCALRFMDVNRYTRIGMVSPAEGQFQPEILPKPRWATSTKRWSRQDREQIADLLAGKRSQP
jgi:hypothetical protein